MRMIGIGSPWGADKLGWVVIRRLQAMGLTDCHELDRPGLYLLELLRDQPAALIIDAVQSQIVAPGSLVILTDQDLESLPQGLSSHGIGLSQTLAIGRSLDCLPAKLYFYGAVVNDSIDLDPIANQLTTAISRIC